MIVNLYGNLKAQLETHELKLEEHEKSISTNEIVVTAIAKEESKEKMSVLEIVEETGIVALEGSNDNITSEQWKDQIEDLLANEEYVKKEVLFQEYLIKK